MSVHIQKSSLTPTINASALVDVAFQLIIYFVLVARFDSANKELPVALPRASAAAPASFKPKVMIISVSKDGRIAVSADKAGNVIDDKTLVNEAELQQILRQVAVNNPGRQDVKVKADKYASWEAVVSVINALQTAGISNYEAMTDGGP